MATRIAAPRFPVAGIIILVLAIVLSLAAPVVVGHQEAEARQPLGTIAWGFSFDWWNGIFTITLNRDEQQRIFGGGLSGATAIAVHICGIYGGGTPGILLCKFGAAAIGGVLLNAVWNSGGVCNNLAVRMKPVNGFIWLISWSCV